ncbi:MAG: FadR family transcriptional regulator [Alphaproteobacteria bacterium]|nr:FadR family transcriptional regulator [Alphaproteobacteria bacterium]MDE2265721.1 FadR family transcriptional regulator [Alphaproteobacteria bacterium]
MTKLTPLGRKHPISKVLRLHGTIARDLGTAIMSGVYQPGDLLTGEVASSERLAVSRTAYREAVRILAAKGLVESKPKVGTKVSSKDKWHLLDPDVLAWAFENEPDLDLLNSLFELRNIVESAAAALAATRRSEMHLKTMQRAIDGMARFTLATEAGRQADQDFHTALLQATENPFIMSLTTGVNAAVNTTTMFKQRNRPLPRDPVPDHVRVFEAIADKNAVGAQKAMTELIQLARLDTPTPKRSAARRTRRKT